MQTSLHPKIWLAFSVIVLLPGCDHKLPPAIISGGSMFPSMPGQHYVVTCGDCNFQFKFDAHKPPRSGKAVCPNCGYTEVEFNDSDLHAPAEPTLTYFDSPLERWQTVAFTNQQVNERFLVKRIIALPGETIYARNGNLFANQQIVVKPRSVYLQVRQLVYDSDFIPKSNQAQRLTSIDNSNWEYSDNSWTYNSSPEKDEQSVGILKYRHIRGYRHHGQRDAAAPIEDSYGYNQNVSRNLFPVSELEIVLNVSCNERAIFSLGFNNTHNFKCRFDSGTVQFFDNDTPVTNPVTVKIPSDKFNLSFAAYDGQLHFEIEDHPILKCATPLPTGATEIVATAEQGSIQINRMQIYRDIHYLQFDETDCGAGYFVLGDNIPISIDSRKSGCIKPQDIIGIVNKQR